jgi:hypothetical protein
MRTRKFLQDIDTTNPILLFMDIVYLLLGTVFFALSVLLVAAFERLRKS